MKKTKILTGLLTLSMISSTAMTTLNAQDNRSSFNNTMHEIANYNTNAGADGDGGVAEIVKYNKYNQTMYLVSGKTQSVHIVNLNNVNSNSNTTLEATKTRFPNRKIVAIFKPHRVGRVCYFAKEFKEALEIADEVGLCPFTSIDDYEEGIDIDITYLQNMIKGSFIVEDKAEDIQKLADFKPAVYVFMSSKNIYDLESALEELL